MCLLAPGCSELANWSITALLPKVYAVSRLAALPASRPVSCRLRDGWTSRDSQLELNGLIIMGSKPVKMPFRLRWQRRSDLGSVTHTFPSALAMIVGVFSLAC